MTGQYEAWECVPGVKLTSPSPGPLGRTRALLVPLHGLKQRVSLRTSSPHLPPFPGEPSPLCIRWNLMPADGPGGPPSPRAPPARPTSLSITCRSVRPRHRLSRCIPSGLIHSCAHSGSTYRTSTPSYGTAWLLEMLGRKIQGRKTSPLSRCSGEAPTKERVRTTAGRTLSVGTGCVGAGRLLPL